MFVWAAFGVALWGAAYAVFGASGMVGAYRAWANVEQLEREVAAAEVENHELEAEIRALKSDPATIERLAREEFFLSRPGERIYLLPPLPAAEEPESVAGLREPGARETPRTGR